MWCFLPEVHGTFEYRDLTDHTTKSVSKGDFPELVSLDNRTCADESVITSLYALEETGRKQYQNYVKCVLEDCTHSIHDTIKKNSLALFRKPQKNEVSKQGKKIKVLQKNVALFRQLYFAMLNRESDLEEFFAHEIRSFPPSPSDFGKLHLPGSKSDLLKCIEPSDEMAPPGIFDCEVLHGAVIVHCLPTNGISTFSEYADKVFIPHLQKHLQDTRRIDIVWDTYIFQTV